jgi:hypothetical protein
MSGEHLMGVVAGALVGAFVMEWCRCRGMRRIRERLDALTKAVREFERSEKERPEGTWIRCSERLPAYGLEVVLSDGVHATKAVLAVDGSGKDTWVGSDIAEYVSDSDWTMWISLADVLVANK